MQLSAWRVNQLQLYMEHTFSYTGHDDVWRHASPFTPDEIAELDGLCRRQHIELVANQNTLGHFERWLRHDRYRPLALNPEGFEWFGMRRGPTTLDPTNPAAFALVRALLAELLPCFSSSQVNVGLDEPWELTPERFGEYLAWTRALREASELDGRHMMMWGDIVAHHPERAGELPADVTVAEWGYEADHPFDQRAGALDEARVPFVLCPGTSSWQTLLGRTQNMIGNVTAAVDAARAHGGAGILMTDWGDFGHLQPPDVSLPGLAYAAGMAWCAATNRDVRSVTGVNDRLWALGEVHLATAHQTPNSASLVRHLYFPQMRIKHITEEEIDHAASRLAEPVPSGVAGVVELYRVLLDDARARVRGDGHLASVPAEVRAELAARLDAATAMITEEWLGSSRVGGLAESRRWLQQLRRAYETGHASAGWPFPTVDLENAPPVSF
jgi:hypothetical protein